jgi:hypothetical protein
MKNGGHKIIKYIYYHKKIHLKKKDFFMHFLLYFENHIIFKIPFT